MAANGIGGIEAIVERDVVVGQDRFGEPVYGTPEREVVGPVLIDPGTSQRMEAARPDGVEIAFTIHFPKTFSGDLRGARIILPQPYAGVYEVDGDPYPYMEQNCPDDWYMEVQVVKTYG